MGLALYVHKVSVFSKKGFSQDPFCGAGYVISMAAAPSL